MDSQTYAAFRCEQAYRVVSIMQTLADVGPLPLCRSLSTMAEGHASEAA
jgi:hypothetical protein